MVQRIGSFEEACRKGFGIVVRCGACGKRVTYRAGDFVGFITPAAQIDALRWRCTWCRAISDTVRYVLLEGMGREDLAKWAPPVGMRRP